MQRKQLFDLLNHFDRCCKTLPIFAFKTAKYDINLIEDLFLPILVFERDFEPIFSKQADLLNIGNVQLLDDLGYCCDAKKLIPFLKAIKNRNEKIRPKWWI